MMKKDMIWVTGGAGFIGAHFVKMLHARYPGFDIWNIDALRYSADIMRLACMSEVENYRFIHADIGDELYMRTLLLEAAPRLKYIVHFAAQTHVDRALKNIDPFLQDNVNALETFLKTWSSVSIEQPDLKQVKFLYVSTDEVYGSLMMHEPPFDEWCALSPSNPYSITKYQAEEVVRKYGYEHSLLYLITRCSNNIGTQQHTEKLIPKMIDHALSGQPLTIYGQGEQVRDWIDVRDHVDALLHLLFSNPTEEVYNIGSVQERKNLDMVYAICDRLDALCPKTFGSYRDQIVHVDDRIGHDMRYGLDVQRLNALGWKPKYTLEQSLDWVVSFALNNQ